MAKKNLSNEEVKNLAALAFAPEGAYRPRRKTRRDWAYCVARVDGLQAVVEKDPTLGQDIFTRLFEALPRSTGRFSEELDAVEAANPGVWQRLRAATTQHRLVAGRATVKLLEMIIEARPEDFQSVTERVIAEQQRQKEARERGEQEDANAGDGEGNGEGQEGDGQEGNGQEGDQQDDGDSDGEGDGDGEKGDSDGEKPSSTGFGVNEGRRSRKRGGTDPLKGKGYHFNVNMVADKLSKKELAILEKAATEDSKNASLLTRAGLKPNSIGADDPLDARTMDLMRSRVDVAKVVDMLGNLRESFDKKKESPHEAALEPKGLKMGNSPADIHSTEWMIEELNPDLFNYRYVTEQLNVTQYRGDTVLDRGDLLVLIDKSPSMSGRPDAWASSVGLASIMRVVEGNRRGIIAGYGAGKHDFSAAAVMSKFDINGALEIITRGTDTNGTDTDDALQHLLDTYETIRKNMRGPDILVITDGGWAPLSPALGKRIKQLGLTLHVVLIMEGVGDKDAAEAVKVCKETNPAIKEAWVLRDSGGKNGSSVALKILGTF